jgi:hypothetical protein
MYPGISLSNLSTRLKYFSCILLPPLVLFIPRFLLRTSARSLPALEQHHSPPELTLHFLSPIPQTHPTTLIAFLTTSLTCALSVALSLKV